MNEVNQDNIFWALLRNEIVENKCDHSKYKQWENETAELKMYLIKRGQVNYPINDRMNEDYWGEYAPIVLSKYPFHNCEIYQCSKCKEFFFYYLENGGHGVQKRYRIINVNLIDKRDYKPNIDTIIDSKSYDYLVQKSPDGNLSLDICIPNIGVGINVKHKLTKEEEELYYKFGIEKLKDRMKDMKINYSSYTVQSWR